MTLTDILAVQLQRFAAYLIGPAATKPVVGWFTWGDGTMVLMALGLAAIAHLAIAGYARWQRRSAVRAADVTAAADTRRHVVGALSSPLNVLIWVYALYLASAPLLVRFSADRDVATARKALDEALNIAGYAMLCWFAYRATYIVENGLRRWTAAGVGHNDGLLLSLLGSALRIGVVAASVIVGLTLLSLPPGFEIIAGRVTSIVIIVSMAMMVWLSVATGQRLVLTRFDVAVADNLRARRIATQLHIIGRVVYIAIALLAGAAILMLFPTVRHVGTSLLASAGIAGVIAGFSAQKILGNLFAGVQIALAQTIRQDDVVVVEGDWGRIEEITLSYVVVHIWDDRRLVLPLSYFIEKPFENWTRTTSALTGSVIVWVDYRIDVADARNALKEIIENSTLWDRRFWNLQVSDTSEHTVQLRVLATSSDSSKSWDLRCEIREKFIAFLQRRHPESLPRRRTELIGADIALPESARRTGTAA